MKSLTQTALVVIALIVAAVVNGETDGVDRVHDETLTTKDIQAAKAFATSVSEEGRKGFTEAFKEAIDLLYRLQESRNTRFAALSLASRGDVDGDQRYQRNLMSALNQLSGRIWGGTRVPQGRYPDAVAVLGGGKICTGTLIAPDVVVTAAHCHCGGVADTVIFGDRTSSARETIEVDRSVSQISCSTSLSNGDLALLFLKRAAVTAPRPIAPSAWIDSATEVRLVGFGQTEDPMNEPVGIKRVVDAPIASTGCNGQVETPNGPVDDDAYYGCGVGRELVAGLPRLDRDSCNGDSGGPAYVAGPDDNFYLGAATSRAVVRAGNRDCGDGGIYARLDGVGLTWIQQQGVNVIIGADGGVAN